MRVAVAAFVLVGSVHVASAARPVITGEVTHGVAGGDILVHYTTTGVDAVPVADINGDGVRTSSRRLQ